MERSDIDTKLTLLFRKVFKDETITISPELGANDYEQWDSLSHMILIGEIESAFSIRFKLKELNKMKNIGDLIDLIILKL